MATEVLACSAVTATNSWSNVGGASKVASVAQPDDDDTSYISGTANTSQSFTLNAPVVFNLNVDYMISIVGTFRRKQISGSAITSGLSCTLSCGGTSNASATPTGSWVNTTVNRNATTRAIVSGVTSVAMLVNEIAGQSGVIGVTTLFSTVNYTTGRLIPLFYQGVRAEMGINHGIRTGGRL